MIIDYFSSNYHFICYLLLPILPIFLYAEIHYRLRFLPSRIYKKQPEILFDIPYRIQTDNIPVLLLIKDAHKFPLELKRIQINVKSALSNQTIQEFTYTLYIVWGIILLWIGVVNTM